MEIVGGFKYVIYLWERKATIYQINTKKANI